MSLPCGPVSPVKMYADQLEDLFYLPLTWAPASLGRWQISVLLTGGGRTWGHLSDQGSHGPQWVGISGGLSASTFLLRPGILRASISYPPS